MKIYEYETKECEPEGLFDTLNLTGSEGWEFITLVVLQKVVQPPVPHVHSFSTIQAEPKLITTFKLIFKREKR